MFLVFPSRKLRFRAILRWIIAAVVVVVVVVIVIIIIIVYYDGKMRRTGHRKQKTSREDCGWFHMT